MPDSFKDFYQLFPVSRETGEKLQIYADLLTKWQKSQNLVSVATLDHLWMRHFADSAQIMEHGRDKGCWVDLGSGAGFPGLVLAMMGDGRANHHVHLVESNQGKCAFLGEVIRKTDAPASIYPVRVEDIGNKLPKGIKTITARAFAPLDRLCSYILPLWEEGCLAILPKGRNLSEELAAASPLWQLDYDVIPSKTDPQASLLRIRSLKKR
ncbi:MAG: 16S rRNA (guanine(527)-N(7))-methyltransferase RsmG [Pseudomonadota bacterium]